MRYTDPEITAYELGRHHADPHKVIAFERVPASEINRQYDPSMALKIKRKQTSNLGKNQTN
jgi:hypothetical protein